MLFYYLLGQLDTGAVRERLNVKAILVLSHDTTYNLRDKTNPWT